MICQTFCEVFTYLHLVALAIVALGFILAFIAEGILELVSFIKKMKSFSEEFETYKHDYLRKDRENYFKLCDLQKQILDLQKGKRKK